MKPGDWVPRESGTHIRDGKMRTEAVPRMWSQIKESQGRSWEKPKRILLQSQWREPALLALISDFQLLETTVGEKTGQAPPPQGLLGRATLEPQL